MSIQSEEGVHGGNALVVVMMSVSVLTTPGTGESEWHMLGGVFTRGTADPGECCSYS